MARPLSSGRSFLKALESSVTPLLAMDAQRRIVFVNESLGQWVGALPGDLVGQRCDYQSGGDEPRVAILAGLCPPPEALAGDKDSGFVNRPAQGERTFERRPCRYVRLPGSAAGNELLLLIVLPSEDVPRCNAEGQSLSPERLHGLLTELRSRLGKRFRISQLIGESDVIARVRQQVLIAAKQRARVLVAGPPGSGREHVARTIHYGQEAAIGPLIPIACELVDAEQMQAQLASVLRRQHERPADGSPTALLLNVDRLRPDAQQELAGFLQLPKIELHTLATARRSLHRMAEKGRFRSDLAYALSTLTILLPPLSKRPLDIPLLAQHFLEELNAAGGRQLSGFRPAAMELLIGLPWPGNIEELSRAVREAGERSEGPQITVSDLPDWVRLANTASQHVPSRVEPIQLDEFLAEVEKEILSRALGAARGNKSKAAQLLGVTRPRLLRRLAQLGLIPSESPTAEPPVIFEPLPEAPETERG